jgi:two-component system sensor histidine kinase DesK
MPRDIEEAIALALREGVTNTVRHAGAAHCRVSLREDQGIVELEIADDGRGLHEREGNGIRGMRERIASVGGSVEYSGAHGTTLRVAIPARGGAPT